MKNHSIISYPSPKPSYLCPPPPTVTTGYAQTNRPGQIGLNQYYDYCRCQRNGWTPDFEKVLCMVTTPPPHQPKIEYFNIFTFEGGGQSKEFFEGGTPQTKSGSAGKRPTLVDAKNAFIRPN